MNVEFKFGICAWRKDSGTSCVRSHEGARRGSGCVNSIKRERGLWLDIILSDSFRLRPAEEKNGACKSSWSSWSTVSTAESGQLRSRVGISFFFIQAIPLRKRQLHKKRRENDVILLMREMEWGYPPQWFAVRNGLAIFIRHIPLLKTLSYIILNEF